MADVYTKLADVIVPEIFVPYTIKRTEEKSRIIQSGIAVPNARLNQLVTAGGTTMNMPFWQDLQGRSQLWTENKDIEVNKITAAADIAALLLRANAWGATDLSGALAGSDPMRAIAELVSDYWARDEQTTLMTILKGVFASSTMSNHLLNRTTAGIDASLILDGKQLLGDSADKLQAIAMHSAVYTELQKQKAIDYQEVTDSNGNNIRIPMYLTYNVIVDDGMPVEQIYKKTSDVALVSGKTYYTYNALTGVYTPVASPDVSDIGDYYEEDYKVFTTYLFARGVIGRGEGTPVSMVPVETDRDSLGSKDILIHRRAFVMHPYGIKWAGTSALETPSDEELSTGTNWTRVYEDKAIGMVAINHRLKASA